MSSGKDKGKPKHTHRHEPDITEVSDPYLALERGLRYLRRIKGPVELRSLREASEALVTLETADLEDAMSALRNDNQALAQEIAYEAMESRDEEEALELAAQAVELDAGCADALHLLAEDVEAPEELLERLQRAADAAAARLGPSFLTNPPRNLWGLVDAGPYLRVVRRMADVLRALDRTEEAVRHYEAILAFDTDDIGETRPSLAGSYLSLDRLEDARRTLALVDGGRSDLDILTLWGRTLERFLSGDTATAERLVREANAKNRFVHQFLTGPRIPELRADMSYEPGSRGEALLCLDTLGTAWLNHEKAMSWLRGQRAA